MKVSFALIATGCKTDACPPIKKPGAVMADVAPVFRYVRSRMRRPTDEKQRRLFDKSIEVIGAIIVLWSKKSRVNGVAPFSKKAAERIALEMMAAINLAIKGAPVSNEVWSTYVDLYGAMKKLKEVADHIATFSPRHKYLTDDLEPLRHALSAMLLPIDSDANEKARFVSSDREYVFDGVRRGRPVGMQVQIARAAALVWQANCKRPPPARKGSYFDEALKASCEYFGIEAPGRTALSKAIAEFGRQMHSHDAVITLRFNRNN